MVNILPINQLVNSRFRIEVCRPALALIDLSSVKMNRIEIVRRTASRNRGVIIVALDQYKSEKMINPLITAGAHAYLLNNTNEYEINSTIQLMFYYHELNRNVFKIFKPI